MLATPPPVGPNIFQDHETHPPYQTRAHSDPPASANSSHSVSSSTVQFGPNTSSGKRRSYDGMSERNDGKVKRTRQNGDHAKRLSGSYTAGPDAKRISLPRRSDEGIERTPTRMPRGANNRGIRPMDTLDRHQAVPRVAASYNPHLHESRGHIKQSEAEMSAVSTPLREQNTNRHRPKSQLQSSPSHPIDLTNEDSESQLRSKGAGISNGSRPASKASQRSQNSTASVSSVLQKKFFGNNEFQKTSAWTEAFPIKEYNGRSNEVESDSQLSLTNLEGPMSHHRQTQNMESPANSLRLIARGVKLGASPSNSSERKHSPPKSSSVPEIDLTRNLPPRAGQITPNDKQSPEGSSMQHHERHSRHRNSQLRWNSDDVAEGSRQEWKIRHFYADPPTGPNFSNKNVFSRTAEPTTRAKAKDRMQTSPASVRGRLHGSRTSMGSEDELSGATTISSSNMLGTPGLGTRAINHIPTSKQPSSSDQLPSARTRGINHTKVARSVEHASKFSMGNQDHVTIGDAVKSLYSQCCVLENGNIELVWDDDIDAFKVEHEGKVQMLPDGEQPFQIDKSTVAHAWVACQDTRKVHLKGSKSLFGNGHTLIEFKTLNGMSYCLRCFMHVLRDNINVETVDPGRMQKIFDKMSRDLTEAFEKKKEEGRKKASSRKSVDPSQTPEPRHQQSRHVYHEDSTKYESRSDRVSHSPPFKRAPSVNVYSKSTKSQFPTESNSKLSDPVDEHRRSGRRLQRMAQQKPRTPTPEKWTRIHNPKPWLQPVTYPTTGARRVTVHFQDLERLDESECLNDNIVDFALRQIEEGMDPQHRRDVHFFNSFFFSALSTKNGRKDFNYDAVKRWTRTTDLFTIPYVVVPINAEFHWFIAIICNLPALQRKILGLEDESQHEEESHLGDDSSYGPSHEAVGAVSPHHGYYAKTSSPDLLITSSYFPSSPSLNNQLNNPDPVIDTEVATALDESRKPASQINAKASGKSKKKHVGRKYSLHDPVIMTLDSLGSTRGPEIRYLKQYIRAEAKEKRAMDVEMTQLLGITAKGVPEQSNFTDCGLYLIGYLEEFAKDPRKFVSKILNREMQETEFERFDPSVKRSEIRESLIGLHKQQEMVRKAHKKEKLEAKRQAQLSAQAHIQTEESSLEPRREFATNAYFVAPYEPKVSSKGSNLTSKATNATESYTSSHSYHLQSDKPVYSSAAHADAESGKADPMAFDALNGPHRTMESTQPSVDTLKVSFTQPSNEKVTPKSGTDMEVVLSKQGTYQEAHDSTDRTRQIRADPSDTVDKKQISETLLPPEQAERPSRDSSMLSPVGDEGTEDHKPQDQSEQTPEIPDSQAPGETSQGEAVYGDDLEF